MSLRMKIEGIETRLVSNDHAAVMATRDYNKGSIIEVCPMVPFSRRDTYFIKETKFGEDIFPLGSGRSFLAGGYALIYSSFGKNNAYYEVMEGRRLLVIKAQRKISNGEFISLEGRDHKPSPKFDYNEPTPWHSDGLEVRKSPGRGFGVFTTRRFAKGDFVEVNHMIGLDYTDSHVANLTELQRYLFTLDNDSTDISFGSEPFGWALGYCSFYNDSEQGPGKIEPNINPWHQIPLIGVRHIAVRAIKDLPAGTELFFDYNDDCGKMSFDEDEEDWAV